MIDVGSRVSWTMNNEQGIGTVLDIFFAPVTRSIQGQEVTCLGSQDNPAYLILTDADIQLLRLKSEVRPENG